MTFKKGIVGYWKGKNFSKKHRENLSKSHIGQISCMKGKKHKSETIEQMSKSKKGCIPWNKGKKEIRSKVIENLSKSHKGQHSSPKTEFKKGSKVNLGRHHSIKTKEKLSKCFKGKTFEERYGIKKAKEIKKMIGEKERGEKHHNWRGGISFEPYGIKFNKELKLKIRKRDNFTCQECKFTEKQLGRCLQVHHIDYNKQNNNPENLISLCNSCHCQTNYKRNDWTNYFKEKLTLGLDCISKEELSDDKN